MSGSPPSGPNPRPFESLGKRSGTILGRYELVRRIGTGGMAEVYEAVHRGLKKTVAVKVLLPETAENPELRARFLREGEAASRIQHPHVVDVTDVAEEDGIAYMVMEYLEGKTLSHVLSDSTAHRLSLERALDILLPIAAALDEAHAQGVVHRDMKPENIFIAKTATGRATPKILDFGVSKLANAAIPTNTAVSAVLGTPHYMSPEQARGEQHVDGRADQYSWALILYECLCGTLPFRSDNVVALIHEVSRGVGLAPSELVPGLPGELDIILLKALRAEPAERYASVHELAQALLPFSGDRARAAYAALRNKDPHSPPSVIPPSAEITGTFGVRTPASASGSHVEVRRPTPTVAARPSSMSEAQTLPPPTEESSGKTQKVGVTVALLALFALAVGGYLFWARPTTPATTERASDLLPPPTPEGVAPVDTPEPSVAAPERAAPEPAPEVVAPPEVRVAIVTVPATAEILLDGEVVGTGELDRMVRVASTPHTLLVRAAGFEERRLEFDTEAPPMRIALMPIGRTGGHGTRRDGHSGTTGAVTAPPDEDLRSTR